MSERVALSEEELRVLEADGGSIDGLFENGDEADRRDADNQAAETAETAQDESDGQGRQDDAQKAAEDSQERSEGDSGEGKREKPPTGYVPHGAFHSERERAKAAEAKLERLEGRFNTFLERAAAAQQPEAKAEEKPKAPDRLEQPLDFMAHTGERVDVVEGRVDEFMAAQQEQAERSQILMAFNGHAQAFKAENPNWDAGYQHAHEAMKAAAAAMGAQDPVGEAHKFELTVIRNALATNQNPAAVIMGFAERFGFQAPAQQLEEQQAAPKEQTAEEKVAKLDEGQRRHRSLSGAPGDGQPSTLSAQDIDKMDDEEFNAFMANPANYRGYERLLQESV